MTRPINSRPSNSAAPSVDLYAQLLSRAESRKSSYLNSGPTRPCDAHLRRSFEHAMIHDGMNVSASFCIPLHAPADDLTQKATRCRLFSASRHMAPIEAPLRPKPIIRGMTRTATRLDSPAPDTHIDQPRSAPSPILDDTALQIVKKDNRNGSGSPPRTRVCKSVSSPARRQDNVKDLEIVPTRVGRGKQGKRKREDDDDIRESSSLSEESREGTIGTHTVRVEDESIILDGEEEPQVHRALTAQVNKRKKGAAGNGFKSGRTQRGNPPSGDSAPQSLHLPRQRNIPSTRSLGQKRKSDQLVGRKSPSKVFQPPSKAPRLTQSNTAHFPSTAVPTPGLITSLIHRKTKLHPSSGQGEPIDGLWLQSQISTGLITSLSSTNQFHHNAYDTVPNSSNPSTSTKKAAVPPKVAASVGSSSPGFADLASEPRITSSSGRSGTGSNSANRQRERQSFPFQSTPATFHPPVSGSSVSQSLLSPHSKSNPENKALGFRRVATKPCSSSVEDRKPVEVSPLESSGPKRFNSATGSTRNTRTAADETQQPNQEFVISSRSQLNPELVESKPSNSPKSRTGDYTSQAATGILKTESKGQNYNSLKLLTSLAKEAVNENPGTTTPPPKNYKVPIRNTSIGKSAADPSLGKRETDRGAKFPLSNSSPSGRRAFTPIRDGAANHVREGRALGTHVRRRLTLTAHRGGEAAQRHSPSARVAQKFAEKWSKKAELLLEKKGPKSDEADATCSKSTAVYHRGVLFERKVSQDALTAQSKAALDSRDTKKEVRKAKPIQPRRMPPFQPVRRRADRPRATAAAPASLPDDSNDRKPKGRSETPGTPIDNPAVPGGKLPRVSAKEVNPSPKKRERSMNRSASADCSYDQVSPSCKQMSFSLVMDEKEYPSSTRVPWRKGTHSSIQENSVPKRDGGMRLTQRGDPSKDLHEMKSISPALVEVRPEIPSSDVRQNQSETKGSLLDGTGLSVHVPERKVRKAVSPMMAAHPFGERDSRSGEVAESCTQAVTVDEVGLGMGQVTIHELGTKHYLNDSKQPDD